MSNNIIITNIPTIHNNRYNGAEGSGVIMLFDILRNFNVIFTNKYTQLSNNLKYYYLFLIFFQTFLNSNK